MMSFCYIFALKCKMANFKRYTLIVSTDRILWLLSSEELEFNINFKSKNLYICSALHFDKHGAFIIPSPFEFYQIQGTFFLQENQSSMNILLTGHINEIFFIKPALRIN